MPRATLSDALSTLGHALLAVTCAWLSWKCSTAAEALTPSLVAGLPEDDEVIGLLMGIFCLGTVYLAGMAAVCMRGVWQGCRALIPARPVATDVRATLSSL